MKSQNKIMSTYIPPKSTKVIIECDCGTHMLQVQSEIDFYPTEGSDIIHYRQEFYLAMFSYGNMKDTIWRRIKIAAKYLCTGKMHADQLCLKPEEAKKFSDFVVENLDVNEALMEVQKQQLVNK